MSQVTSRVKQGYINHVGLVLDASGSMRHLRDSVVKVSDLQMQELASTSQTMDQETRATVYQFDNAVECLFYDKDVLRLPSVRDHYFWNMGGTTALVDATLQAIHDLRQTATLYGDHAFLLYVLTDGLENASNARPQELSKQLSFLPKNWTVAIFVPNEVGVTQAKQLGFAPGNIKIWETTEAGMQEVARVISSTTNSYMSNRTRGITSYNSLFSLDTAQLTAPTLHVNLIEVEPDKYHLLTVLQASTISEFVGYYTGSYVKGNTFYQLVKPETVQAKKQVAVLEKSTKKVYSGGMARQLLGLPNYDVKVEPAVHPNYDIFIQSTSVNRKLVPGQQIIVFK
jgi:hypothetical protein